MTEILNIGRLLGIDNEGFIISESDFAKIKSPWKEACLEIKEAYLENLEGAIHSIYVRGTVSRGEAIEGISDIDTFAILNREVQREDRVWFRDVAKKLEEKYSFATDIELNLLNINDVLDEEKGFNDRFTIKVQSVCLYGEDLSLTINPFKPDLQTASHFHRDLGVLFDKLKLNINKDFNTEKDIEEWCRWIMKRIIRAAFVLVMDKEKKFTRDLYPTYSVFSKYYPEKELFMKKALELAINPSNNKEEIILFIDDFGVWIQNEIEDKFK